MSATIDKLEHDKQELEASNAKIIGENRDLLDQLEGLNNQTLESDGEIQALTATLQSTRQQLQRLSSLADRATDLETQLMNLELEHASLESQFTESKDQQRMTIQRWKRAEGTITYLQDQIDKIEREAKEERERHVEVLGRLERRRVVEKELENAAGRLKGAAAAKSLDSNPNGTNVVSHFVRDILQDNANLQLGVVELREMLMGSNAEVENLREQLLLHQPIVDKGSALNVELEEAESSAFEPIPELHVHHHYHQLDKTIKRPKKKRPTVTSGHFTPSGTVTPRQKRVREWQTSMSSTNTIMSQTSVTVPSNRWSFQSSQTGSSFAPSSIPSSPYRSSSVFDPIDSVFESRPTSPETSVLGSSPPPFKSVPRSPGVRLFSNRSVSNPTPLQLVSSGSETEPDEEDDSAETTLIAPNIPDSDLLPSPHDTIPEEIELDDGVLSPGPSITSFTKPRHRRATSHESLFSLAGGSQTTHPLRQQFSQNFDLSGRGFSPIPSPFSPTTTSSPSFLAASPTLSHATATIKNQPAKTSNAAKTLLSQASSSSPSPATGQQHRQPKKSTTGGWAWGKWGKMPLRTGTLANKTPQSPRSEAVLRSPGVNQAGFIRGLVPPPPAPVKIEPEAVDEGALREAMAG